MRGRGHPLGERLVLRVGEASRRQRVSDDDELRSSRWRSPVDATVPACPPHPAMSTATIAVYSAARTGATVPCRAMSRARAAVGVSFLGAGALHFLRPRIYEAIMPRYLPAPRELVYASGVAEIAGGAGMLHPRTARPAAWWLIATMVGVFPANVEMAVNAERFKQFPRAALWARLPLQALIIAAIYFAAARRT